MLLWQPDCKPKKTLVDEVIIFPTRALALLLPVALSPLSSNTVQIRFTCPNPMTSTCMVKNPILDTNTVKARIPNNLTSRTSRVRRLTAMLHQVKGKAVVC